MLQIEKGPENNDWWKDVLFVILCLAIVSIMAVFE